jgi:hypothetical protein
MPVWLDAIFRASPVVAALVAITGVWVTVAQKNRTDRREQWWKRVQWAAEQVVSDDEKKKAIGAGALLTLIAETKQIDLADSKLLDTIVIQGLGNIRSTRGPADAADKPTNDDGAGTQGGVA